MKRPTRQRLLLTLVTTAAVLAGTHATADAHTVVVPVGMRDGHPAFAVGPYATAHRCAPTAARIITAGGKRHGPSYGTCYRNAHGWWALSPWAQ